MSVFDRLRAWWKGGSPVPPPAPRAPVAPPVREHPRPTAAPLRPRRQFVAAGPPAEADGARTLRTEDARLEDAARAALAAGDLQAALTLFQGAEVSLLARHAESALPCLCARCLDPARSRVASGGATWVLDFVVARHRALFYWMPAELQGRETQVRASMRGEMRDRLLTRRGRRPARNKLQWIDPFAGRRR